jgi:HTH-type transcriptional regulator/antitoxin HigA
MLVSAFLADAFKGLPNPALLRRAIVRVNSKVDLDALLAWQARILQKARELVSTRELGKSDLSGDWLATLVRMSKEERGALAAIEFLWSKGIVVVVEPHLPGTFLDGAAVLLDGIPVIGLTLRQDRLDNFWFVLLHELGHIFKHRSCGLERGFFDEDLLPENDPREAEANEFAQRALIPEEVWKTSFVRYTNSAQDVYTFASKYGIGPWIVAGRIRRGRSNYKIFGDLVGRGLLREQFKAAGLLGDS